MGEDEEGKEVHADACSSFVSISSSKLQYHSQEDVPIWWSHTSLPNSVKSPSSSAFFDPAFRLLVGLAIFCSCNCAVWALLSVLLPFGRAVLVAMLGVWEEQVCKDTERSCDFSSSDFDRDVDCAG